MNYQDHINLDDVKVSPRHQESFKEIERLILEEKEKDNESKSKRYRNGIS